MRQMAILFLFISQLGTGKPSEEVTEEVWQELEGLTVQVIHLVVKEDTAGLRRMIGKWAVGGVECSDIVFLLETRDETFQEEVQKFGSAAEQALQVWQAGELDLETTIVSMVPPGELLIDGDIIVREGCEWGLLFRLEKKQWRVKGFFLKPPEQKEQNRRGAPRDNPEGFFIFSYYRACFIYAYCGIIKLKKG